MDGPLPDHLKDAKIQGMNMKIGVALSQDGKAWGRVECHDPTGAVIVLWDRKDHNAQSNVDMTANEAARGNMARAGPHKVVHLILAPRRMLWELSISCVWTMARRACIIPAMTPMEVRRKH